MAIIQRFINTHLARIGHNLSNLMKILPPEMGQYSTPCVVFCDSYIKDSDAKLYSFSTASGEGMR